MSSPSSSSSWRGASSSSSAPEMGGSPAAHSSSGAAGARQPSGFGFPSWGSAGSSSLWNQMNHMMHRVDSLQREMNNVMQQDPFVSSLTNDPFFTQPALPFTQAALPYAPTHSQPGAPSALAAAEPADPHRHHNTQLAHLPTRQTNQLWPSNFSGHYGKF
eukprot:GHVT01075840.1.p1 GENE.GHVT01075840.1~~GHVT01075840.1.p1  ORF type:complete len:160 (+),score=48.72 GHVT01075840.1:3038-3517(+)